MSNKSNPKRKASITILLWVSMLFMNFTTLAQTPYNVVMNIYQDPKTQMAFNWLTAPNIICGQVEIVPGEVNNHNAFEPPNTPLSFTATISQNANKAVAIGLSPNTTYSFRVGTTGIGKFTTKVINNSCQFV